MLFNNSASAHATTTSTAMNSAASPRKLLDVVIVGGGLSGMMVAHSLQQQHQQQLASPLQWNLLEARSVLGGRLTNDASNTNQIDMGGAWIWPFHQPYMKRLAKQLNLPTFTQPDEPSSTRFRGGAVQLIHALQKPLPASNLRLNAPIVSCSLDRTFFTPSQDDDDSSSVTPVVRLETANKEVVWARRVVFAVPPRLLAEHVTFDPPLSPDKRVALQRSHTWMAGVTKVALIFPTRFWSLDTSNMGLNSATGPAFQMYDSSTYDESVTALTFFTVVKPSNTQALRDDGVLAQQVAQQLASTWKYLREPSEVVDQVSSYTSYVVQRWPQEKYISEDPKPSTVQPHPHPARVLSEPEWPVPSASNNSKGNRNQMDHLLHFAGSETDRQSPGVMEGAVSAAQRVLQALEPFLQKTLPALKQQEETSCGAAQETVAS